MDLDDDIATEPTIMTALNSAPTFSRLGLLRMKRALAIVFGLVVVAAVIAVLILPPLPDPVRAQIDYSDGRLYRDIVSRMLAGESYYEAATSQQRMIGYPLKPFVTVREPALAWILSTLGFNFAWALHAAVIAAGAICWQVRLAGTTVLERAGAGLACLAAAGALIAPEFLYFHEAWAGAFAFLCLALAPTRLWPAAIVAALAAVLIRELSAPLLALCILYALREGPQSRRIAWVLAGVVFAAALGAHALTVEAHVLAGDRVSPGWTGHRGFRAPLADFAGNTILALMPIKAAMLVALASLIGLFALPGPARWLPVIYCIAVATMVAVFARPVNNYWFMIAQPMWFLGLPFVPRLLRQLIEPFRAKA